MKYIPDTKTLELEINEAVERIVQIGIEVPKRASMLMAYGINASNINGEIDFHLSGFVQPLETPQKLTQQERYDLKDDFRNWVVGNGFRELLEGTETFLNSLVELIAPADFLFQGKRPDKATKTIKKFEGMGVWQKLKFLEDQYGFKTEMAHYYESLTQARNCLTHRKGIVGDKDIKKKGHLELEWLGVDAKITEHDGTEHILTLETKGPIDSSTFSGNENATLTCTYVKRTLIFQKGELIDVHPRSLQEICSMSIYTCAKLHQLIMNWLMKHGVKINGGKLLDDPVAQILLEAECPD